MKQLPSIITSLFTGVLLFILLSFTLPNTSAQAAAQAMVATGTVVPTGTIVPTGSATTAAPTTVSAQPTTPPQPVCTSDRSVKVSGTAVINVAPDRALIQLGVQSNGTSTRAVEETNSATTQAVIKAMLAMGIDAQDIATDWYVIEPLYDNYDSLYIKGYRINNMVAITLRDVSKTSSVIAAALQAGANQVINVEFYTSELRKYRDQAREMAMKAAHEKAQALAAAAGTEAGCVLSITENSWSSYNGWWAGRGQSQNQWTQNVVQNIAPSASASSPTGDEPISLGKISVKAEIDASFGLQ